MAYYRRRRSTRRSTYRSRGRGSSRYARRSYGRRSYARRRTTRRRSPQRIVIQVVGANGMALPSPATLGKKSARVVRARF